MLNRRKPYGYVKTEGSHITKEGKNTCMIGDSIVKGINMREFNKYVEHSTAIKRSFPGARTKQLMYYIEDIPNEENLHRIIINVGTNNLSDQNQTENEIMMEIIEIAKKCHQYGINEIFIAGLTIRPRYDKQINIINNLLKENATKFNYRFIDNTDIMEKHLWKDKLHLNEQGTIILANNFLHFLNKRSIFYSFY